MIYYEGVWYASEGVKEMYAAKEAGLPQHMRDFLGPKMVGGSPVDRVCHWTESVYANRDQAGVDPDIMGCAAGCALVINDSNFWGSLDGRATGIMLALRRDSGEMLPETMEAWPDPSEDPEPKAEYLPPAPEE